GDLAPRPAQPGARLEPAGRGLEADAEELLPTLAELLAALLVGHRPERVSFQRDPPPASRTSCVPGASGRRGEAPRGRAAPGRRRARTSRDQAWRPPPSPRASPCRSPCASPPASS